MKGAIFFSKVQVHFLSNCRMVKPHLRFRLQGYQKADLPNEYYHRHHALLESRNKRVWNTCTSCKYKWQLQRKNTITVQQTPTFLARTQGGGCWLTCYFWLTIVDWLSHKWRIALLDCQKNQSSPWCMWQLFSITIQLTPTKFGKDIAW